jgi:hypothetical protein
LPACAQAEALAAGRFASLVWMVPCCLVADEGFQARACQEKRRQIFLFQALLSALLAARLLPEQILLLPHDYNYPYNLQASIPAERRAPSLNNLVSFVYEDRPLDPSRLDDIRVSGALKSFLAAHPD